MVIVKERRKMGVRRLCGGEGIGRKVGRGYRLGVWFIVVIVYGRG